MESFSIISHHLYVKIGVYCRAGHHRSVAMGEMLKKYVYKNAKIKHLTIHR